MMKEICILVGFFLKSRYEEVIFIKPISIREAIANRLNFVCERRITAIPS